MTEIKLEHQERKIRRGLIQGELTGSDSNLSTGETDLPPDKICCSRKGRFDRFPAISIPASPLFQEPGSPTSTQKST